MKPSPKMERITVPGRNGDVIRFTGGYENVTIPYNCGIIRNFDDVYTGFMNALLSDPGYHRLEDSYHPDIYRMAALTKIEKPGLHQLNRDGAFTLSFDCRPQSFLKIGETPIEFAADGTVWNPTPFASRPLLRIWGTGSCWIGEEQITILTADEYTDLDCEEEDAYKDTAAVNCNGNITLSTDHFPTIPAGKHLIVLGDGISRIRIIPRWWRL